MKLTLDTSIDITQSVKFLLLAVLGVLIIVWGYILFHVPSSNSRSVMDITHSPTGKWRWEEFIFPYYPDVEIYVRQEDQSGEKYLHVEFEHTDKYTGFGISKKLSVPDSSAIQLIWRCKGEIPFIQVDMVDGSIVDESIIAEDPYLGEAFNTFVESPEEQWTTTFIPLNQFERSNYQDEKAPKDGIFDTDGIRSVSFTIPPDVQIQLDLRQVAIVWEKNKIQLMWVLVFMSCLCLLLYRRSTQINFFMDFSDTIKNWETPTSRIVFTCTALALVSSILFAWKTVLVFPSLLIYLAMCSVILLDEYHIIPLQKKSLYKVYPIV